MVADDPHWGKVRGDAVRVADRPLPGWIVVGRPSERTLDQMLQQAEERSLNYKRTSVGPVGATLSPGAATRVHHESRIVGRSPASFDAAVASLGRWACHAGISARIHRPDTSIEDGRTLLVVLPAGPVSIVVQNRIVATVDEPDRFGFAYGSLDGHHERGEESFLVERLADDRVRCTIAVDAHPATFVARAVGPAITALSHVALRRYLRAWEAAIRNSGPGPTAEP